jgi:hypothetical protein
VRAVAQSQRWFAARAQQCAIAALIAAAADGKALLDDECAKKAVAELNRDRD